MKQRSFKKFLFEFLSVFFAIIFAFLLDRWNDDRKERLSEKTILTELYNGLARDSIDINNDSQTIKFNIQAVSYFRRIVDNIEVDQDSLASYYFFLTRDFLTIQNTSGYETLKSMGLEIVEDDSLRKSIIDLYEVSYELHRKFTEEYDENKYMRHYFVPINNAIAPHLIFDRAGNITGINQPINLSLEERNMVKSYLWRLQLNRLDRKNALTGNISKVAEVRAQIRKYLK